MTDASMYDVITGFHIHLFLNYISLKMAQCIDKFKYGI